jgi:hypothetical protein
MADVPAARRRWKRWAAFGLALLAISFWYWTHRINLAELSRAQGIRLGQTKDEVIDILGRESMVIFYGGRTPIIRVGRVQHARFAALMNLQNATGWRVPDIAWPRDADWPIQIRFDHEHRVDRIQRGSEVIERPVGKL